MNMLSVQVYQNYPEAHIAMGALEQQGIPSWLDNENTMTIIPMLGNAGGGIRLMVSEEDYMIAKELLSEIKLNSSRTLPCPKCTGLNVEFVSTPRKISNWLTALATSFFGDYAIAPEKVYHCFDCGYEFEQLTLVSDDNLQDH